MSFHRDVDEKKAELMRQRILDITGGSVVDVLHAVMYGARIRTMQEGKPCYYRGEKHVEGWPWPLIDGSPVEPVRRLTQKDYLRAITRTLNRGVTETQIWKYVTKARKENSSIARSIDELDNIVPGLDHARK